MFGLPLVLCLMALALTGIEPKTQDFECSIKNPCKYGQGDCKAQLEDKDCEGNLVCGHNNCDGEFNKQPQGDKYKDDCCSTNRDWCNPSDLIPSYGPLARTKCCSEYNKCGLGQGDCDFDKDCQFGLVCGNNNCNSDFGHNGQVTDDCCTTILPRCVAKPLWRCCSYDNPCDEHGGDCEYDDHCKDGLVCGSNNCHKFHPSAHRKMDCCVKRTHG